MKSFKHLLVLVASLLAGCGSSDECTSEPDPSYNPTIDPANFVAAVDNRLWPLVPGTRHVFQGGGETVEITVTSDSKEILGVRNVVVNEKVTVGSQVLENILDWYAQDRAGNVWHFGEAFQEFENGSLVSREGSWEAGVDGAKPGIVMHALQPAAGAPYRQEYSVCVAESMAEVVSLSQPVTTPFGTFQNCLQTHEFTPLDTETNEHKYYCPGVGLVLEVDVNTGDRSELTGLTRP